MRGQHRRTCDIRKRASTGPATIERFALYTCRYVCRKKGCPMGILIRSRGTARDFLFCAPIFRGGVSRRCAARHGRRRCGTEWQNRERCLLQPERRCHRTGGGIRQGVVAKTRVKRFEYIMPRCRVRTKGEEVHGICSGRTADDYQRVRSEERRVGKEGR